MIQSQGNLQQGFVDRSDVDERGISSMACTSMASKTGVCAPRVLLDVERTLLLEDLKYVGVPVGVLKSLIAKIEEAGRSSQTDLMGLGFNNNELNAYQLLMQRLGMMGAVLPEQAVVRKTCLEGTREIDGRLTHIKWREPDDELKGAVDLVSRLLGADSDLLPRDILVVAPGAVQCGALCEGFSRRHLAYQYVAPPTMPCMATRGDWTGRVLWGRMLLLAWRLTVTTALRGGSGSLWAKTTSVAETGPLCLSARKQKALRLHL